MAQQRVRGWFDTKGRPGDRTINQQLMGLDDLMAYVEDRTVLDVGCAEGLISIEMARRGARAVHGIEREAARVDLGRRLVGDFPVTLEKADANVWKPRRMYDVVIALALLHKLKDPSAACARLAAACADLMVLRLPPAGELVIVDERSGRKPHDVGRVMELSGFVLEKSGFDGPYGEHVSYWKRVKA